MTSDIPRYTRAPDLDVHETEDGLIVFNAVTDRVHHLNYTAGVLFECCRGTHSADELAEIMVDFYALDETPVEAITTGLQQLVAEGVLIETRGDSPALPFAKEREA